MLHTYGSKDCEYVTVCQLLICAFEINSKCRDLTLESDILFSFHFQGLIELEDKFKENFSLLKKVTINNGATKASQGRICQIYLVRSELKLSESETQRNAKKKSLFVMQCA